jgi:hypothetical protein
MEVRVVPRMKAAASERDIPTVPLTASREKPGSK